MNLLLYEKSLRLSYDSFNCDFTISKVNIVSIENMAWSETASLILSTSNQVFGHVWSYVYMT